ncbi:protein, putative [Babesia ovata]|uniref:Protein, putative n=1 Tax=Babesia ovata TaxID=189622 RepID=A0A2H6KA80_9APIC|nr:protein, putative [Babesia ovata]GBE59859.1 protein, putative [Babesia ovata]
MCGDLGSHRQAVGARQCGQRAVGFVEHADQADVGVGKLELLHRLVEAATGEHAITKANAADSVGMQLFAIKESAFVSVSKLDHVTVNKRVAEWEPAIHR